MFCSCSFLSINLQHAAAATRQQHLSDWLLHLGLHEQFAHVLPAPPLISAGGSNVQNLRLSRSGFETRNISDIVL